MAPRMTQLQDSLTPHGKTTQAHFAFTRHTHQLSRNLFIDTTQLLSMAHTSPPHTTSHISHLMLHDTLHFTSLTLSHNTSHITPSIYTRCMLVRKPT